MPGINTKETTNFANWAASSSPKLVAELDELSRLYHRMELNLDPIVATAVPLNDGIKASDDIGDAGIVAQTLVNAVTGSDHLDGSNFGISDTPWYAKPTTAEVDDALRGSDALRQAGDEGKEFRDQRNAKVSTVAMLAALSTDSDIEVTDDGLIVAYVSENVTVDSELVDDGLEKIGLGLPFGVKVDDLVDPDRNVETPLYQRGGTTYGNVFVTGRGPDHLKLDEQDRGRKSKDRRLIGHEVDHTYQGAAAGAHRYGTLYVYETYVEGGSVEMTEKQTTILGQEVTLPWAKINRPDPKCDNAFEEHANFSDGGYTCPP